MKWTVNRVKTGMNDCITDAIEKLLILADLKNNIYAKPMEVIPVRIRDNAGISVSDCVGIGPTARDKTIVTRPGQKKEPASASVVPIVSVDLFKVKNKRGTDPATPNNNKIPVSPGILIELP